MIAITSISPSHINGDIQQKAVNSWIELGFKVVSLNGEEEISSLKSQYTGVEFISTTRTMNGILAKPLISINAMLDYAKESKAEICCIINSDILLVDTNNVLSSYRSKMDQGIVCGKRRDFKEDINDNITFESGFDFFFIHKKFLSIFHQSIYAMGATHWDYWIPYTTINKGVPLYLVREPFAYHKMHNTQYLHSEWERLSDFFAWENMIPRKGNQHLNQYVFNEIHKNLK